MARPEVESAVALLPEAGAPVPEPIRGALEQSFGHSLSSIRIHDDQDAHAAAAREGAAAFATGDQLVFGAGKYRPDSIRGRHLLAHEVAHAVQQRGAAPASPGLRSSPSAEQEAGRAADAAVFGGPAAIGTGSMLFGTLAATPAAKEETEAQRLERIVTQFPFMSGMFPGWAFTAGSDGVKAIRSDGMTAVTRSADVSVQGGFGAQVSQQRVAETDKDHRMESSQSAGWKDGAGFISWMTGGKYLADDGTKRGEQSGGTLTVGPDKVGAKSSYSRTEDTVTKSRSMEVSRADGKVQVDAEFGRKFELDADHKMEQSTKVSVGSDGASLSRSNSSRIKDVEMGTVESESKRTTAGWSADKGLSGQYSKSNETEIGDEKFGRGTNVGISKDGVAIERTRSHSAKDADGNDVSTSGSRGVNVALDGTTTYTTSTVDAKGNKTSYSMGGNLDPSNANVQASVSRNGWKLSGKVGRQVIASDPRQVGEQWAVDWAEVVSASGGGGAKGISVSGSMSKTESGTRLFGSTKAAEEFQKDAAWVLNIPGGDATTVGGALQLGIGESRGIGTASKAGAELSASPTGGSIGVGASTESSSAVRVTRLSATVFELTYTEKAKDEQSLSASTLGIGARRHSADTSGATRVVQVDVATELGRGAFESFTKGNGMVMPGAKIISDSTLSGHDSGQTFGGPGFSLEWAGFTEEEQTTDKRGRTERYTGGTRSMWESSVPWEKGHNRMIVRLDQTETNDADSRYVVRGSVDSTKGSDSASNLAKMTGTAGRDFSKATTSGKWGIEVELTEEVVEQFLAAIGSERIRETGLFDANARNDLRVRLKDAKSSDDRKRALATFFAEAGVQGNAIEALRNTIYGAPERFHAVSYEQMKRRGGNFFYDLSLPGDANFRGVEARKELETKIAGFDTVLRLKPEAAGMVHEEIAVTLREVRRQRGEVADPTRYTDLPDELRENQVSRLDMYIGQLEGQLQQSGVAFTMQGADQVEAQLPGAGKSPYLLGIKKVRWEIGTVDKEIATAKGAYTKSKDEFKQWSDRSLRGTGALGPGLREGVLEANGLWSKAEELKRTAEASEPATNEARSNYVRATDPDWAVEVGHTALRQLEVTKKAWEESWFKMVEAEDRMRTAVQEHGR